MIGDAGAAADGTVTLVSLTIFQMHEWIFKPDVYFKCQGEERRGEEILARCQGQGLPVQVCWTRVLAGNSWNFLCAFSQRMYSLTLCLP